MLSKEFTKSVENNKADEGVRLNAAPSLVGNLASQDVISPPGQTQLLEGTLLRGIAWTGAVKWVAQLLSWASTLIVARLLTPDDYGLVGMAIVYLGLVAMVNEFGLGSAIVALHELDGPEVAQINSLSVLLGLAGFALSCFVSIPLARFYGAPQLARLVTVMSLTFIIMSFKSVPYSILQRELKFRLTAQLEGVQVLCHSLSTVLFALIGYGYWSLAFGSLVGAVAGTIPVCVLCRPGFALPRLRSLKKAMTFSRHVVVARIAWYIQTNADFLVAGRVLGKAALGAYTFAWTLASLPIEKITGIVSQVTFPFFSAVQNSHASLRHYLLKLTEGLALLTFPVACGLALAAREFVLLVLGEKWSGVVVPLQILAAYATLRAITPLLAQILFVTGESRFVMKLNLAGSVVLPVGFLVGSRWGTTGIALAWILLHPFISVVAYRRVFRKIGLSFREYVYCLWPAVSAGTIMIFIVLLIEHFAPASWHLGIRLGLEILGGIGSYGLALRLLHPSRLQACLQLIQKARQS
jgi:PST family polysaccharide transporter